MRVTAKFALLVFMPVGLPLLGVSIAGYPPARYLEFPPLTRYVKHAPFHWPSFIVGVLFVALMLLPFLIRMAHARLPCKPDPRRPGRFPWWGWLGLTLTGLAWVLAWTRFPWFADLQPFTFSPLWIGYILVVNALAFQRTGSCLMLDRPRHFLFLFPLSAAFWWFFEYLNRFVQNWYYVGADEFTPAEYVLHATLPFSTVLPAVLSTAEWLNSFPRLTGLLHDLWPIQFTAFKAAGWTGLLMASAGLAGIGIWPDYLFPLLWVSPLVIVVSLQTILGERTVFSNLAEGDWRPIGLPAVAGLICGFFWEMWNVNSLAHWEYVVPYVHRFQIFEMPLLGYAGYLPFGVECKVIAELFLRRATGPERRGLAGEECEKQGTLDSRSSHVFQG
ncbi:MAG: hypothetical protein ICV76_02395 [Nitrospiraceae bacterium]|nr:hypothetical protein [Nitrospiraceae bacterium]